jgi:hypothetical protein
VMRGRIKPRQLRRALVLSAIGAAALLLGPLVGESRGGTYISHECASAYGGYSIAQFESNRPISVITRDCGWGGVGLGAAFPAPSWSPNQTGAAWNVGAPQGTHFEHVSLLQRGASHPSEGWELEVFVFGPGGGTPLGASKSGLGGWVGLHSFPGTYTAVSARLTCVAAGGCNGSSQAGLYTRDYAFTMVDDAAPSVNATGELLNGQVQRGTGRIEVSASDVGAGLAGVSVSVNDQVVASENFGCPGIGVSNMQPCSLSQHRSFELDTQGMPFHDGINELRVCVSDYATESVPNVRCTPSRNVRIDNSCPASRVAGGSELSAQFVRNDDDALTVRSRIPATIAGRLTDRGGAPVAGAALCIKEATLTPDQPIADAGVVRTDSAGRYRYTVAPGPNRTIEVGYRYNRHQLVRDVRYLARVIPTLKLSRDKVSNGDRIRLFGRLPGPSNEDRIVVLQARYPGKEQRWKTFQKARTDERGRFTAPYRFLATFVTTTYGMRALVPKQNGYPFLAGHSRRRPITVLGR